ncbi:MAG: type II secretion system F family protein [Minisyncoccia bacterium]
MIYTYKAYNKDNKIIDGEYEASSNQEVVEYLAKISLTPVSVHAISTSKKILSIELFDSITSIDIVFLIRNLATTIKAGLSIVESIDILIKDTKKNSMRKILQGVKAKIENGQTLSSGFEAYKESFPPIFIGMVKAGEVSGQLGKSLSELARYLSKEYTLRSKIKSALTYPIILLIASALVVTLMLVFVLPKLTQSFAQSGVTLPWITKAFLFVSQMLTYSFILDLVVLGAIVFFFTYFRKTATGKKFFFFVTSHTPVAKDLIKKIAVVRFAHTFGNLIGSGLSVVESLSISSQSINNQSYTDAIDKSIEDIKNGISVSEALSKYPKLFPSLLISLIMVGERTGSLQEILMTFADFYEEEVDNTLKELTAVLEPVLLIIMGLMIGAIAVSIILPIYQLVGHFI